jgi:hypothetical protein
MSPLVRCGACDSPLLQLERMWLLADGRHVAERRCPECERYDAVAAAPDALLAWRRREERLLARLADEAASAVVT